MTWSPTKLIFRSGQAKAMWLAVWPGVATACSFQPAPSMTSPLFTATSGLKSRSAPDSGLCFSLS